MSAPTLDSLAEGLTDEQVDDVRLVIKAMQSPRISATEVAGLLGVLRRVAELPADDPQRQAWAARKRDVLDRITAGGCAAPGHDGATMTTDLLSERTQ